MASRSESTAYHLTSRGWIVGDRQLGDALPHHRPAPIDQVLSIVFRITTDSAGRKRLFFQEMWRSRNNAQVLGLLARFGAAPARLATFYVV